MGFVYLFLVFILLVVVGILSMAGSIIRSLFGFGSSAFSRKDRNKDMENDDDTSETLHSTKTTYERRGKLFGPQEGEYVDFEEVKDDDK